MAIVYSMKTARSLLQDTEKLNPANKKKSKAGLPLTIRSAGAYHQLYSDLDEDAERKLIWETATFRPNTRYNFLGADWNLMIDQLAERYDVRNMTWTQLDTLGRLWVETGLLSANEYSSMVLVSRLKVNNDSARGYVMLEARSADEAFNVLSLWNDRAAGLSVISSGLSYEGADRILHWLGRMSAARAAYVERQRRTAARKALKE
ncbi:MAG: hypothetical protein GC134_03900 [Proteobacteria bacterium]|nr:hypothetical protein [Pseudomonadota bacterium]